MPEVVVFAVPSRYFRSVAELARSFVSVDADLVSVTKGIEPSTCMRMSQVLAETLECDNSRICVLSGPNLAREVMAGRPSATVIAADDRARAERLQGLFMDDSLRVYTNPDVIGCEIGGAVKNVIAIAAGIADGLGYGWNTKAALITRGLAERMGVEMPIAQGVSEVLDGVLDSTEVVTKLMHREAEAELHDLGG